MSICFFYNNNDSFRRTFPLNFLWKSRMITSFLWSVLKSTIALNQSARQRHCSVYRAISNSVFFARCRQMKSIFFHYLTFTVGDAPLKCDWPTGVCSYNKEPCPPGKERCSQRDSGCKLDTNYCCCTINKQTGKLLVSKY